MSTRLIRKPKTPGRTLHARLRGFRFRFTVPDARDNLHIHDGYIVPSPHGPSNYSRFAVAVSPAVARSHTHTHTRIYTGARARRNSGGRIYGAVRPRAGRLIDPIPGSLGLSSIDLVPIAESAQTLWEEDREKERKELGVKIIKARKFSARDSQAGPLDASRRFLRR